MVAAVIQQTGSWYRHLLVNWFDFALLFLLIFAFWRGRKRGMTKELLPTLEWLAILFAAGLGHVILADWFQKEGFVRKIFGNHFQERTAALMSGYICIAIVIFIVAAFIKRKLTARLEGSNFFGGNEYYWGVAASVARYLCMALVALALLNAPLYTTNDIAAAKAYNNRWFGGGLKDYSGDFIPSVYEVQDSVFRKSFAGKLIKSNLSMLLINPDAAPSQHAQL
jgi:uncharacterized membrane protein required for colicin V production